ncbi:hypothetical protein C8R46DRAFT_1015043 [Mycena filopes]|nr:hypothetical protein C8R46DRAFT_1015043 [Mycena filopes]
MCVVFGCPEKLKPEGDSTTRVCPNCHNPAVMSAQATTWFELFWLPLIPMVRKNVWLCDTCHWKSPRAQGQFEPPVQGQGPPQNPSYQPGYMTTQPPAGIPMNTYQPQYAQGGPTKA